MKSKSSDLQKYIFIVQVVMIIILALLLGGTGLFLNLHDESRQRDINLRNMAEAIAHSQIVESANEASEDVDITESLDTLKESLSDIDVISVVGKGNIRLYHSNHELIGTVFEGNVPDFDNENYIVVSDVGPSGETRRAYAPIRNSDGDQTGFVMAIMLLSSIKSKTLRTVLIFAAIIVAAILIELFISYKISGKVREKLLGYEPDAFSAMFKVRDTTLESLEEGIIAVDKDNRLQFANEPAVKMLDISLTEDGTYTERSEKLCAGLLGDTTISGKKEFSVSAAGLTGPDILIDRIPLAEDGSTIGAIGILHDRAEYTRLAEDLAGTRFLVDSMRANNHDFTNKLHVILGLLQMEMYDEAQKYIENITLVQRENISQIMNSISSPALAALLIGKTSRASELNIRLILRKDSSFNRDDIDISENALVTIIGNLIENALEAINGSSCELREVYVGINSQKGAVLITVDDTGPGISEEIKERIFEKGVSGKGSGRGIGLWQVMDTVSAYNGNISVESQQDSGTSFTISFTREND